VGTGREEGRVENMRLKMGMERRWVPEKSNPVCYRGEGAIRQGGRVSGEQNGAAWRVKGGTCSLYESRKVACVSGVGAINEIKRMNR